MTQILHIDASARLEGSASRELSARLARTLAGNDGAITRRDLARTPPSPVSADWIAANFTEADKRSPEARAVLAESEALIAEIEAADTLVIGVPVYNFAVPSVLKAWIDQVARARRTFRYTETGPQGMMTGKRAFLVIASGGTAIDSAIDFATPYLRHMLGFIGITDVTVIAADRLMFEGDAKRAAAEAAIGALAA